VRAYVLTSIQAWRILQSNHKYVSHPVLKHFFAQIASSRKDVECAFGRMKNRFRMLKLPLMFESLDDVRNLFVTCCIFHNALLEFDEAAFSDEGMHSPEIVGNLMSVGPSFRRNPLTVTPDLDVTGVGIDGAPPMFFHDGTSENLHFTLRDDLALHYSIVRPVRQQD
jgi:hypothetical protein